MIKRAHEIKAEIDATLDRLLANDNALREIRGVEGYEEEVAVLEKLQESLMAHLMHLDGSRETKQALPTRAIAKRLKRSDYVHPKPRAVHPRRRPLIRSHR